MNTYLLSVLLVAVFSLGWAMRMWHVEGNLKDAAIYFLVSTALASIGCSLVAILLAVISHLVGLARWLIEEAA